MDKEYQEIVRDTYKNLTLIEDFHLAKSFIVDRSQAPKADHDKLFTAYHSRISNTQFKDTLKEYYDDSKGAGVMTSQANILSNYLVKFHFINAKELSHGNEIMAGRIMNEKYMQDACIIIAKDLLKGKIDPLSVLAAKEAEDIRKQLNAQKLEIKDLKEKNSALTVKVQNLSSALHNLVSNIKTKFSLSDPDIDLMQKKPAQDLSVKEIEKVTPKIKL